MNNAVINENQVYSKIISNKFGKIYHESDFYNITSEVAVRKALQRLEKDKKLIRLARGLYLYPKKDPVLGVIYPSISEIADEIKHRDRLRLIPSGDQALLQLGLTTQVPMTALYLTDGGPRRIKIGTRTLIFKPTTPKMLALKGKISSLIIQALKALGKQGATAEVIDKLSVFLKKENQIIAEADAALAPAWIRDIMLQILRTNTTIL